MPYLQGRKSEPTQLSTKSVGLETLSMLIADQEGINVYKNFVDFQDLICVVSR